MKLVIIESPLSAPTREGIEENKKYARACMSDSLNRYEAPFASHLLYDQTGILDDLVLHERERGMQAGFAWGSKADLVAVYIDRGISNGMRRGIDFYVAAGLQVEYRRIYPQTNIVRALTENDTITP